MRTLDHGVYCDNGCSADGQLLTESGHCPDCASNACLLGMGRLVGLPVTGNPDAAVAAVERVLAAPAVEAPLLRVLLSTDCPECGRDRAEMAAEDGLTESHRFVEHDGRPYVVIGCEGFQTAALRAAALLPT